MRKRDNRDIHMVNLSITDVSVMMVLTARLDPDRYVAPETKALIRRMNRALEANDAGMRVQFVVDKP